MKKFLLPLLFFFFSLGVSWASVPDSCKFEEVSSIENPRTKGKNNKKFTIYVKVSSASFIGEKHISNLKNDRDLSSFYNFELLVDPKNPKDEKEFISYISYNEIFLGVIHGAPSKSFLVSLQPVILDMIKDPKIMSQPKGFLPSAISEQQ